MNYFKAYDLYFVKGIDYQGDSFSLLRENDQEISIFSKLSAEQMEPYAINAIVRSSINSGIIRKYFIPNTNDSLPVDNSENIAATAKKMADQKNSQPAEGVYIQMVNQRSTDIELVTYADAVKKCNSSNSYPKQEENPKPSAPCVVYVDGQHITAAEIQDEFNQGLVDFERKNADAISALIIKNNTIYNVTKLYTALSIVTKEKEIWLNKAERSLSLELTIPINNATIMLEQISNKNGLEKHLDGLLLVQSLGYNTQTPYAQFMSTWVLLEKFIQKYFKTLEDKVILDHSRNNLSYFNDRTKGYINSICCVSNSIDTSKFKLRDKFILCCAEAKIKFDKNTIDLFSSIKDVRDGLHSSIREKGTFPTNSIFQLLYLFFPKQR